MIMPRQDTMLDRRQVLQRWAGGIGGLSLCSMLSCVRGDRGAPPARNHSPSGSGRAKHVIFLYMDGGPSQMDTFDPKPRLAVDHGKPLPMQLEATQFANTGLVWQSPFRFARHGQCGADVSELFPCVAQHVDELAIVRSMVSEHSEHSAANFFLHTGSPFQGRPTMGSWVSYGLGSEQSELPNFVVLDCGQMPLGGRDCFTHGFLPAEHQATVLLPGETPIPNLLPPVGQPAFARAELDLVTELNRRSPLTTTSGRLDAAIKNYELAFRMQTAVPELLDIGDESQATWSLYGLDNPQTAVYGRQCLLARRLVERGVQFVQLLPPPLPEHNHWDQHTHLAEHHRGNALAVDRPIAGLLSDLRARGLWDETIVLWGGEFGRTPTAQEGPQGKHGRDHNPFGFTMWLAGAGIRPGTVYGATDDFGYHAVENPVNIHDLHATLLSLLGLDHTQVTYRFGGRDYRLTDVYGEVMAGILA